MSAGALWCRYHTIARMVRAGYNVLSVHADSHFSDDPYTYLKRPPLNKAILVTMSHGGWTGLTSGFLYIQNAAISGPVSWIFTETVDRVRSCHLNMQLLYTLRIAILSLCVWRCAVQAAAA